MSAQDSPIEITDQLAEIKSELQKMRIHSLTTPPSSSRPNSPAAKNVHFTTPPTKSPSSSRRQFQPYTPPRFQRQPPPIFPANTRCFRCNRVHKGRPCGAVQKRCYNCQALGHLSSVCRSSQRPSNRP